MAECGICLDALQNPVSVPCGHVHCERCLRDHINSGVDALRSACPTCRKQFHIASPDLVFVPQKYHHFILPSVRKIYMDVPSTVAMTAEIDVLKKRLEALTKENDHLRKRCVDHKYTLQNMASEKRIIIEREQEARQEADDMRKKYESLKRKYREVRSRDSACDITKLSQGLSRKSSQNLETSHEILPKVEEDSVSLRDLDSRPKRALPKSRLSNSTCRGDEETSQFAKRQRTHRYSDVGSSSQLSEVVFKGESEEDE